MSDLIENKSRQLEHDSKILDFGKDEEDEKPETAGNSKNKPETGNSGNQTTPAANTSNSTKNTPTSSKPVKEKDVKDSGGKYQQNVYYSTVGMKLNKALFM